MIEHEKSVYSQNGEDGIIEYIFNTIGTSNKIAVEFGVSAGGSGSQNNTRLLADTGWNLFWFDLNNIDKHVSNVTFKQVKLNIDNIQDEFNKAGIPEEFDLLSIDVDGNDYHFREKLKTYSPRVCVLEYNGAREPDEEYIMPYDNNYSWSGRRDHKFGASLLSLTKLSDQLGYDLVYVESNGVNAFFVRKDINVFEKKTPYELWKPVIWDRERRKKN
jgi:hypothetical protein